MFCVASGQRKNTGFRKHGRNVTPLVWTKVQILDNDFSLGSICTLISRDQHGICMLFSDYCIVTLEYNDVITVHY